MKIFKEDPLDWQGLENRTAELLTKAGMYVEQKKQLPLVRGQAEIDVYAIRTDTRPQIKIICECKYWKSKVTQTVIHAIRTVVADSGANIGYVISSNGFQEGAYSAKDFSNIEVVTWQEFQQLFLDDYLDKYFYPELGKGTDKVQTFTEPISPAFFVSNGKLEEQNIDRFLELKEKYQDLAYVCLRYSLSTNVFTRKKHLRLPLCNPDNEEAKLNIPNYIMHIDNLEEFLTVAVSYCDEGYKEFKSLLTDTTSK